ncbi:hypothetical protein HQ535_03605 [bacterium]|nr:hypothetical protein [bacterium]
MSSALSLIGSIDRLYERVMDDPGAFDESEMEGWYTDALGSLPPPVDKQYGRWARRAMRLAKRMAAYWADTDRSGSVPPDWRNGIDQAHGPQGWQPTLEIARRGLEIEPTEELFDEMQRRFREVNLQPWLDVTWDEWLAERQQEP